MSKDQRDTAMIYEKKIKSLKENLTKQEQQLEKLLPWPAKINYEIQKFGDKQKQQYRKDFFNSSKSHLNDQYLFRPMSVKEAESIQLFLKNATTSGPRQIWVTEPVLDTQGQPVIQNGIKQLKGKWITTDAPSSTSKIKSYRYDTKDKLQNIMQELENFEKKTNSKKGDLYYLDTNYFTKEILQKYSPEDQLTIKKLIQEYYKLEHEITRHPQLLKMDARRRQVVSPGLYGAERNVERARKIEQYDQKIDAAVKAAPLIIAGGATTVGAGIGYAIKSGTQAPTDQAVAA